MNTVQILSRWKDFPEHTMGGIINSTFQEGHGGVGGWGKVGGR